MALPQPPDRHGLALNQVGAGGFTRDHVTQPDPAPALSGKARLKAQPLGGGQPGQHVPKAERVLGGAGSAAVQLGAGAAGRDALPPGEPVSGAQGAGRTVALPRRLLRQPAAGIRTAVVPAAAAGGARSRGGMRGGGPQVWKFLEARGWVEGCLYLEIPFPCAGLEEVNRGLQAGVGSGRSRKWGDLACPRTT